MSDRLADALLKAIKSCGKSLNVIAGESGISTPQLSRFVRGERSLTLESADKLFAYFGLKFEGQDPEPEPAPKKRGKK